MTVAKTITSPASTLAAGAKNILRGFGIPALYQAEAAVQASPELDLFGIVTQLAMCPGAVTVSSARSEGVSGKWHGDGSRLIRHTSSSTTAICSEDPHHIGVHDISRVLGTGGNTCLYIFDKSERLVESEQYPLDPLSDFLPVVAWFEASQGATTESRAEGNPVTAWATDSVSAVVAAGLDEHFESGYESGFRKSLAMLHKRFGSAAIKALCTALKGLARPYSSLLRESFSFLSSVRDEESRDFRLVFLASYLNDPSPVNRDSAAISLADMGDKRGVEYLRAAAERETHPRLKYEYLEIAAELEM